MFFFFFLNQYGYNELVKLIMNEKTYFLLTTIQFKACVQFISLNDQKHTKS